MDDKQTHAKYSTLLVTREVETKTTRYHYILVRMGIIPSINEDVERSELSYTVSRNLK